MKVAVAVMLACIVALGLILIIFVGMGNSYVVIMLIKGSRIHSSQDWLVLTLALANLWVAICFFSALTFF